jgi:hypothetical protein
VSDLKTSGLISQDTADSCCGVAAGREAAGHHAPLVSKARLVITAILAEKRSVSEVARSYVVARS